MKYSFGRQTAAIATLSILAAASASAGDGKSFDRQFHEDRIINMLTSNRLPADPNRFGACFVWNDLGVAVATNPDGSVEKAALADILGRMPDLEPELAYRAGSRWTSLATDSSVSLRETVTILYSFVPDGLNIPSGVGEPASASNFFATLTPEFGGSVANIEAQFAAAFNLWADISGIEYQQVADDGAVWGSPGVVGSRGDVRISMHPIDGTDNVLAYNSFPNNGDMVIDTADSGLVSSPTGSYRRLKNLITHEHGHGIGYNHVLPVSSTKLMEPFFSISFTGPQIDDKRGVQFQYGDDREPNDTAGTANALTLNPPVGETPTVTNFNDLSIETNGEVDFYAITFAAPVFLNVTVTPTGGSYLEGAQCPAPDPNDCPTSTINAGSIHNLDFEIRDTNGTTVLTTANATAAGSAESITSFALNAAGTYYIRVFESSSASASQLYNMAISYAFQGPPPPPAESGNWSNYK